MINLSTRQLLVLWSELDDALHGKNGFGGDTAEIYAHTLLSVNPSADSSVSNRLRKEAKESDAKKAAESLYSVLKLFSKMRDCDIFVENKNLADVPKSYPFGIEPIYHRIHVKVKRK